VTGGVTISSMLNIVTIPDPILRKRAEEVTKIDERILKIVDEMIYALENNPRKGIGLAAPQVGIPIRIIIAKSGRKNDDAITYGLINPEIIKASDEKELDYEGCLSVPDTYGLVERSKKVVVKALNKNGKKVTLKASGLFARVLQHEIDHLDGILLTEKSVGKMLTEEEYNKLIDAESKL